MADRLIAWLHGTPVATLTRAPEFRIRMEWRAEGTERWGRLPPVTAGIPAQGATRPRPDGTWRLPNGDAPSTWILKPDGPHAMAANEATCLRLAAACGLNAAAAELLDVAGLRVLAVKRYDRAETPGETLPARCIRKTAARRPRRRQR